MHASIRKWMHIGRMAASSPALIKKALDLLSKQPGPVRLSEALRLGVHRDTIRAMRDQGQLIQVSRGLYLPAKAKELSDPDLVVVAKRVPGAVVCLISALAFHELTTQIPHEVHIALKRGRRHPRFDHPPLQVYWWTTAPLTEGVEKHVRSGVELSVTTPERSVADAFRYRNRLGVDLAVEALRAWRERRGSRPDALLKASRLVRVEKVVQPYLQAIL
jgi:predicted transcriptional regulator of viral defense system